VADIYGVVPADVARELSGLFPSGFDELTSPTAAMVEGWISTADTIASLRVTDVTGANPASSDKAAVLAKRYIIEWTKEQVIRSVYAGNDIERVDAAAKPFAASAKALLSELELLGSQAVGTGEASSRVRVSSMLPTRDLIVTDAMLDTGASRARMF
jgi:hypothetical protein